MTEYWNNDNQKSYIKKLVEHPAFYIGDLNLASFPVSWIDYAKYIFATPKALELTAKGHTLFARYFNPYHIELHRTEFDTNKFTSRQCLYINRYFVTPFFLSESNFYIHDSGSCDALLELIMFNGKLDEWISLKIDQEVMAAQIIKEAIEKV